MKRFLIAVAALAALTGVAAAHGPDRRGPPTLDGNGDGWIARTEMEAQSDALFARLDRNGDAKLDAADRPAPSRDAQREDARQPMRGRPPGPREGGGRHGHGPGFLALGPLAQAAAEEGDRNGDDALSRDEFRAVNLRFFDAADADGDGRLRLEPRPAPR